MIPSTSSGRVTEWSIVAVSKTVVRVSVPGVRIPPLPPVENGKVAEWLKAHPWKGCMRGTVSRVRISLFPPYILLKFEWFMG